MRWLQAEARVRAHQVGEDAAGNPQILGVLEVGPAVLEGFAAPEGSRARNKAIERINKPLRCNVTQ